MLVDLPLMAIEQVGDRMERPECLHEVIAWCAAWNDRTGFRTLSQTVSELVKRVAPSNPKKEIPLELLSLFP